MRAFGPQVQALVTQPPCSVYLVEVKVTGVPRVPMLRHRAPAAKGVMLSRVRQAGVGARCIPQLMQRTRIRARTRPPTRSLTMIATRGRLGTCQQPVLSARPQERGHRWPGSCSTHNLVAVVEAAQGIRRRPRLLVRGWPLWVSCLLCICFQQQVQKQDWNDWNKRQAGRPATRLQLDRLYSLR